MSTLTASPSKGSTGACRDGDGPVLTVPPGILGASMKITDIKTIRLRAPVPSEGQVHSRRGVRTARSALLIEVQTDAGITGLGSCSGNATIIEVIVAKVLKPLLLGMDPTNIEAVWDKAYFRGGTREFGARGIGVVALSGIDIALWDIAGKAQ